MCGCMRESPLHDGRLPPGSLSLKVVTSKAEAEVPTLQGALFPLRMQTSWAQPCHVLFGIYEPESSEEETLLHLGLF